MTPLKNVSFTNISGYIFTPLYKSEVNKKRAISFRFDEELNCH